MLRLVYRALWWIVAPLAVLRLLIRSRKERGYREHIGERFGRVPRRRADDLAPLIWVHAVSVGETRAAQPLIDALMKAHPEARILLTHMTPSGRATGVQIVRRSRVAQLSSRTTCRMLVRRFLRAWRPSLGIVMETEVWPTLIDECKRARRAARADERADVGAFVPARGEVRRARRAKCSAALRACSRRVRPTPSGSPRSARAMSRCSAI